jgi:hypothetical protein
MRGCYKLFAAYVGFLAGGERGTDLWGWVGRRSHWVALSPSFWPVFGFRKVGVGLAATAICGYSCSALADAQNAGPVLEQWHPRSVQRPQTVYVVPKIE